MKGASPYVYPGTFRKLPTNPFVPAPYIRYATIKQIVRIVCKYFHLDPLLLSTTSRRRDIVRARHICWYMFKRHCYDVTLRISARTFGTYDHTTVIHGLQSIENKIETEPEFRAQIEDIEQLISNAKHFFTEVKIVGSVKIKHH